MEQYYQPTRRGSTASIDTTNFVQRRLLPSWVDSLPLSPVSDIESDTMGSHGTSVTTHRGGRRNSDVGTHPLRPLPPSSSKLSTGNLMSGSLPSGRRRANSDVDAITSTNVTGILSVTARRDKDPKKSALYKTELCRSFEETGHCRYSAKCQFAHGMDELRQVQRHPKYKTEICRTFWEKGTCPYGKRCCFVHNDGPGEAPVGSSAHSLNSSHSASSLCETTTTTTTVATAAAVPNAAPELSTELLTTGGGGGGSSAVSSVSSSPLLPALCENTSDLPNILMDTIAEDNDDSNGLDRRMPSGTLFSTKKTYSGVITEEPMSLLSSNPASSTVTPATPPLGESDGVVMVSGSDPFGTLPSSPALLSKELMRQLESPVEIKPRRQRAWTIDQLGGGGARPAAPYNDMLTTTAGGSLGVIGSGRTSVRASPVFDPVSFPSLPQSPALSVTPVTTSSSPSTPPVLDPIAMDEILPLPNIISSGPIAKPMTPTVVKKGSASDSLVGRAVTNRPRSASVGALQLPPVFHHSSSHPSLHGPSLLGTRVATHSAGNASTGDVRRLPVFRRMGH